MPISSRATQLLEHILDHGRHDLFPILSDVLEEEDKPVSAKVFRSHQTTHQPLHYEPYEGFAESLGPPIHGDYESSSAYRRRYEDWQENGYDDPEGFRHSAAKAHERVKKTAPEVIPGVHLNPHGFGGYQLYDFRDEFPTEKHPEIEQMYEEGRDDEARPRLNEMQEHYLDSHPAKHYFYGGLKRDKLDLAKPLPIYEDPGDEVHITGLSKGGNCEHCGKPDIYRIHVKHPISGETCKIGSSCASGMLRDSTKRNLTGKMQPKDILHKAATAQALGDVGSVVKVRLKNKDTKLKLAKVPTNFEDPGFSLDDITGGVIHQAQDHLEHLDTIERERGKGHWMTHVLRTLQQKRIAGDLPHNPNVSRANPRAMPKKFVLAPQNDEGTHPYWFMGHWGDEEQPHFHIGYARTEGNSVKRSNGRTTPVPLHPEEATTFLDPAIAHAEQHGHKQTKKMLEGLKKEAVKRWGKAQPTITSTEEHMWPHVADEHMRGVLADHLEEMGDPLHHFLRAAKTGTPNALEHFHPGTIQNDQDGKQTFYHPHITHLAAYSRPNGEHQIYARIRGTPATTLQAHVPSHIAHQIGERLTGNPVYLSRPNVIADANSQAQDIRKFIAAKIAKEARLKLVGLEDARGQDTSGVVQAYEAPGDAEGVDYAAAWYGLLTNQPKVTTFHENDQGPDTFYKWKVAGDPDQALKTLPPGTLITKDNFAHYLDRGSQKPVDNVPGVKGTAVTMQGRPQYRDLIKRYQGPDETPAPSSQGNRVSLAAPSSVIVKVPLPQPVSQTPQQPPTLKKPSRKLSYVLPI